MKGMSMDNTTMSHMSMNHDDHHSTAGHGYYFHFSAQATILFAGWTTVTAAGKYYL